MKKKKKKRLKEIVNGSNGSVMEKMKTLGMKDSGHTSSLVYNIYLNTNKDTKCNILVVNKI